MTHASLVQHGRLLPALLLLALAASVAAEDHLIVYRVGDGAAGLLNTGAPVFLDEYTTSGVLVRSIPLPTTANGAQKQLIASGTASSEGFLSRSADGNYIVLTGYARDLGGSGSISGTTSAAVPRVVGRVAASGLIDTSTALTDFSSANNPRSAVSTDGTVFWAAGAAGSGVPGIRYAALGSTTSTALSATTFRNARQINIFGGQLYTSSNNSSTGILGVGTVGTGLPTTGPQTVTRLAGLTDAACPSSFAYSFADLDAGVAGLDTLYIADDDATNGGIKKYSLVTGNWALNGTMGAAAGAYRGLTARVSGTDVIIYATRLGGGGAAGGGELVTVTDSTGYNATPPVSPTITLLATAATNTAFRGVAFAPTGVEVNAGNSTVSANPGSVPANGTASSTITVTLKDAGGNTVGGKTVSLAGVPNTSTITPASVTTNSSGQATFTVKSTTANTVTYTATDTDENVIVTQTADVTFAPVADATLSSINPGPPQVLANGVAFSTITVTLKDSGGVVVSGKTVTLAGVPNTSIISAASGPSDANGVVTFTVSSTTANTVTYTATDTTDNVIVTQTAQVTFLPVADAAQSTVLANPTSVLANGIATSTITVTLKDSTGNAVSGKMVRVGDQYGVSNPFGPSDSNGQASIPVASIAAGSHLYSAFDITDNVMVTQQATVNFLPVADPVQSTMSANPASVWADNTDTSTITVTLKDSGGAAVSGKTVTLAGVPATSTISAASGPSDANGQVTFTVKSSTANTVTYTATDTTDNVIVTQTAQVTFNPVTGPGTHLEVRISLTIEANVSIAWGGGTTGKNAGDVTALDWTVHSATTGAMLDLGQTLVSNDPNNSIVMNVKNTSATNTNARVSATVVSSGGWSIGPAATDNTFTVKARLGSNPEATLAGAAQELTGPIVLSTGTDQPLVVTVMTPTSATNTANRGVERTISVALTATPQ